jgi:hypothetical protein
MLNLHIIDGNMASAVNRKFWRFRFPLPLSLSLRNHQPIRCVRYIRLTNQMCTEPAVTRCCKSQNQRIYTVGRLQFASIVGWRTKSVEIFSVMFVWCKLLSILHFRLFLLEVVRYSYIESNRQMS